MSEAAHDIKKEVRIYTLVFGALLFLTVVTVGVSYLHFTVPVAITVGLIVATVKASLVAGFFMHLAHERKLIYLFLILTVVFFAGMVALILSAHNDKITGTEILEPKAKAVAGHGDHHGETEKSGHGHH